MSKYEKDHQGVSLLRLRPLVKGDDFALINSELSGEKWLLSFTFWPVLINGWCIGYMLADDSCTNRTK